MKFLFNALKEKKSYPFTEGLPRTIASIGRGKGFFVAASVGFFVGMWPTAMMMSAPGEDKSLLPLAALGTFTLGAGAIGGAISYYVGYGVANLAMQAFPSLQGKKSKFLIGPDRKSQMLLSFVTTTLLVAPIVINNLKYSFPDKYFGVYAADKRR